jgi:hypothetical protein
MIHETLAPGIEIYNADCLDVMREMEDGSVDAVITDPPYEKKYQYLYGGIAEQSKRILKKGGSLLAIVPHYAIPQIVNDVTKHLKYRWAFAMWQLSGTHPRMAMGIEVIWKPILGGCKIEGVVIKNYNKFTDDKKTMMAKYVSTEFQEKHQVSWRKANPTRTDILDDIIETYRTEARWRKAVQHLRERGELEETPRDIGALIREVKDDVKDECEEEIKDRLFGYFWKKDIERSLTHGLPEWYKEQLANKLFEEK